MGTFGWIDISMVVREGMAQWPGDRALRIDQGNSMVKGDPYSISSLTMSAHTGTHIDAPAHFIRGGATIDQMPMSVMIGPARVIEIADIESVKAEDLGGYELLHGERILLKTRNSQIPERFSRFIEDYVYITEEAAQYLVDCKISLIGIDYLSAGGFTGGEEVHRTLLGAGIWILEGLDLSAIAPGTYDLICLPLKIENGDGAPARAALRAKS